MASLKKKMTICSTLCKFIFKNFESKSKTSLKELKASYLIVEQVQKTPHIFMNQLETQKLQWALSLKRIILNLMTKQILSSVTSCNSLLSWTISKETSMKLNPKAISCSYKSLGKENNWFTLRISWGFINKIYASWAFNWFLRKRRFKRLHLIFLTMEVKSNSSQTCSSLVLLRQNT